MFSNDYYDTTRLQLGLNGFSDIRTSNMIYVDKTSLIFDIASQRSPIFFSRPRRFEKSLLLNTLSCLFENGIEDFRELDIEKSGKIKLIKWLTLIFQL